MNWGKIGIGTGLTAAATGAGWYFGGPIGGLAAGGIASGLFGTYLQMDQQDYERGLQRDVFSREDNSVLRRVADLKGAGLSPVLAAGQGAGTGSIVPSKAPEFNISEKAAMALSLMKMNEDISTTQEQRKLIAKQVQQVGAQINQINAETRIKNHDAKIYEASGMASTASGIGKDIRDILGLIGTNPEQVRGDLKGAASGIVDKINKARSPLTPEERVLQEKIMKEGMNKILPWRNR